MICALIDGRYLSWSMQSSVHCQNHNHWLHFPAFLLCLASILLWFSPIFNPFGEDYDEFETNAFVDRNVTVQCSTGKRNCADIREGENVRNKAEFGEADEKCRSQMHM
ncbi:hypothetical protein Y032_0270g863 [Ancylostoma ceylanicum]|uniref:Bestrophin homolog n=1 Tax=Ancylostoma ceylanicum TaxID=53326 RepID=A0A016S8L6_9BILA|nr:hypothetical protein Y032_0270g863 [Ancylostoma ceylanicum]